MTETTGRSVRAAGHALALSPEDLSAFRRLIYDGAGISMSEEKRELVSSRLARRVRALSLAGFAEYRALIEATPPGTGEWQGFINALTTNKTSFFREAHHFHTLAEWFADRRSDRRPIRIWSSACSTGEEPWTIAMVASEALGRDAARVRVLATDIDTDVLDRARRGVYETHILEGLQERRRKAFLLRGVGEHTGTAAIAPVLRPLVTFAPLNLVHDQWDDGPQFDIIFCRNVVIYFDAETRARLFTRLSGALRNDGRLFLGHSEALIGPDLPLEPLGHTTWRRLPDGEKPARRSAIARPVTDAPPPMTRERTDRRSPTVRGATGFADRATDQSDIPSIRIIVGAVHVATQRTIIRTTLGSCIAACLYDPIAKVGGMNHFLLPDGVDDDTPARYGVHAMELLINKLMQAGADRRRIVAKVFGGSSVLKVANPRENVAQRNIAFIRRFLEIEGLKCLTERLGGDKALDVAFDSVTGETWVRIVDPEAAADALAAEQRFRQMVKVPAPAADTGDVTLF